MAAWGGGPCPGCGEEVRPRVVRCPDCRTLLDPDLSEHEVAAPTFAPLAEAAGPPLVRPKAEKTRCPGCEHELRVSAKYAGVPVACKKCGEPLTAGSEDLRVAFLADCPHCKKEVRVATKYESKRVGCKFCSGELIVERREVTA